MKIKVTKIGEPKQKNIHIECPECGEHLSRTVPMKAKEGKDKCYMCMTPFKWEEVEEE